MKKNRIVATSLLVTSLLFSACGKDVSLNANDLACPRESRLRWSFVQPQATQRSSVDLMFVVDSSSSIAGERARVARTLSSFVDALLPGVDYRIGVMQAHGGASTYSGRLSAVSGTPLVLNSQALSRPMIQAYLEANLAREVKDRDEANGEAGLFSAANAMTPANLASLRDQGMLRPGAALSVVWISDENDVCYNPQAHGFSSFPDYSPSTLGWESVAESRYCSGVSPESVVSTLKRENPEMPLSLGAIVQADPTRVPRGGEEAIGHGYVEAVSQILNGVVIDITSSSYTAGMKSLGEIVSTQLKLDTRFGLSGKSAPQPISVRVSVDGKRVGSRFDSGSRSVEISAVDAGSAGSRVDVEACP